MILKFHEKPLMNQKIHKTISNLIINLSSGLAGSKQIVRKELFYSLYNRINASREILQKKESQE